MLRWNNKIRHSTAIIFYIMFAFLIQACGGSSNASAPPVNSNMNNQPSSESSSSISAISSSSSSASNMPLSLDLPETLKWQENQDFSYYIPSEGTAPIEYTLLTSPDAHLFSLDVSTGNLTLNTVFDHEQPLDVDLNNTYELSVQVSNASGVVIQGNLSINIENIVEYQGVIDFPIDGSNVGGFDEATIHVRGHVLFEGQRIISLPSTLAISVNDQVAVFLDDGTGSWSIEVPLNKGMNPLNIRVRENENIVYEGGIGLKNIPVSSKRTEVYYGDTSIYSIAVGGHAIVKSSTDNTQTAEVLNISDIANANDCPLFRRILLSNSSTRLIIECEDAFLVYSIEEKPTNIVPNDLPRYSVYRFPSGRQNLRRYLWIDESNLLYNITEKSFKVINILDNTSKDFEIYSNNKNSSFAPFFFINENLFYILTIKEGFDKTWTTFNINKIINESDNMGVITTDNTDIELSRDLPQDVISRNGMIYILQNDQQLIEINLQTKIKKEINLAPTFEDNVLADFNEDISSSLYFMFSDEDNLILKNRYKEHYYSLNTDTGDIEIIKNKSLPKFLLHSNRIFISPNNTELFSYGYSSRQFLSINLTSFSLIKVDSLIDKLFSSDYASGSVHFDWENKILYRTPKRINSYKEEKVLAYYFKTETDTSILNENEVLNYLSGDNIGLAIKDISVNKTNNSLWFSVNAGSYQQGGVQGVYSLNMEKNEISTLYETTFFSNGIPIGISAVSDFYTSINGVILTGGGGFSGAGGFISILDADGNITKITPPVFIIHGFSLVNENRHLLYYAGYRTTGDDNTPNVETMEIYEHDLITGTHKQVASNNKGVGFDISHLSGSDFVLDTSKQNLLSVFNGRVFIIDTYSGDRVIKGLALQ